MQPFAVDRMQQVQITAPLFQNTSGIRRYVDGSAYLIKKAGPLNDLIIIVLD